MYSRVIRLKNSLQVLLAAAIASVYRVDTKQEQEEVTGPITLRFVTGCMTTRRGQIEPLDRRVKKYRISKYLPVFLICVCVFFFNLKTNDARWSGNNAHAVPGL